MSTLPEPSSAAKMRAACRPKKRAKGPAGLNLRPWGTTAQVRCQRCGLEPDMHHITSHEPVWKPARGFRMGIDIRRGQRRDYGWQDEARRNQI